MPQTRQATTCSGSGIPAVSRQSRCGSWVIVNEYWSKCWAVVGVNGRAQDQLERIINVLRATPANQIERLAIAVESYHRGLRMAKQSRKRG